MSNHSKHPSVSDVTTLPRTDAPTSSPRKAVRSDSFETSSATRDAKVHRACIVRYDFHPGDSRIENQAQALLEDGFEVDIFCMRRKEEPITSISNGVRIIRLPSLMRLRSNLLLYAAEYAVFWIVSFFALSLFYTWRRYDVVQVCNLPDFLVFVAIIPKWCGAKVILDFRENMIEMYMAKFELGEESRFIRILAWLEQSCVRFSHQATTCTEQMKNATIARGTPENKVFVMLNSVDPRKFYEPHFPDETAASGSTFNIVTHGSIIPRYGHETLLRAMKILHEDVPEARLDILGIGQQKEEMEALCHSLGLDDIVRFWGFVSHEEMIRLLRKSHVGAVTMVRNAETDLIHTIKMQEYMVLGLPIVISRTSAVEGYFDESTVQFFEADNPADLAQALLRLRDDPSLRSQLAINAYNRCEQFYKTNKQKQDFASMVRGLINR